MCPGGVEPRHVVCRGVVPRALNLELMRRRDEESTAPPCSGSRRMTAVPRRASAAVHRNRVMRLMSPLGWAAIDPKPLLSRPDPDHGIDRYWRRGVTITRPDQVWRTDSPAIRLLTGGGTWRRAWMGLAARCWHGGSPTPWTPGSAWTVWRRPGGSVSRCSSTPIRGPFTRAACPGQRAPAGIRISRDGRGRAHDKIFVERRWRSVKYEEVSPQGDQTMAEADRGRHRYFAFSNHPRPHQALGYRTPAEVSAGGASHLSLQNAESQP